MATILLGVEPKLIEPTNTSNTISQCLEGLDDIEKVLVSYVAGDIEELDAHVRDTACQARAAIVCWLYQPQVRSCFVRALGKAGLQDLGAAIQQLRSALTSYHYQHQHHAKPYSAVFAGWLDVEKAPLSNIVGRDGLLARLSVSWILKFLVFSRVLSRQKELCTADGAPRFTLKKTNQARSNSNKIMQNYISFVSPVFWTWWCDGNSLHWLANALRLSIRTVQESGVTVGSCFLSYLAIRRFLLDSNVPLVIDIKRYCLPEKHYHNCRIVLRAAAPADTRDKDISPLVPVIDKNLQQRDRDLVIALLRGRLVPSSIDDASNGTSVFHIDAYSLSGSFSDFKEAHAIEFPAAANCCASMQSFERQLRCIDLDLLLLFFFAAHPQYPIQTQDPLQTHYEVLEGLRDQRELSLYWLFNSSLRLSMEKAYTGCSRADCSLFVPLHVTAQQLRK